jgi:hypothetical protein
VFLVAQIPIADSRPFLNVDSRKLKRPRFGSGISPYAPPDFLRGFGSLAERRRGLPSDWPAEDVFCHAARGIHVENTALQTLTVPKGTRRHFKVALRRYLSNGEAVSRPEVGFSRPPQRRTQAGFSASDVAALLRAVAELTIGVRTRGGLVQRKLAMVGPLLAAQLLSGTTQWQDLPTDWQSRGWWVTAGRPLIIFEYRPREIDGLPRSVIRAHVDEPDIQLHHMSLGAKYGYAYVWLLRSPRSADPDRLRGLRLHLGRLHTEREVLSIVLSNIADHGLTLSPAQDDPLKLFLEQADGFLRRESVYGFEQSVLLKAAYSADDLVNGQQRRSLLAALGQTSRTLRQRLEEATRPASADRPHFPL